MTLEAPAASARATSRGSRTPPSAQTWAPTSRAAAAHSRTAENCGRPTPVCMRVVHIAPGPTPTLIMSAPAAASSRTPSAVTILPAAMGSPSSSALTLRSAVSMLSWWPWAVSMTRTSAPASARARARPSTSPLMPTAAPMCKRPCLSTPGLYIFALTAPFLVRIPAKVPSGLTTGASLREVLRSLVKASCGSMPTGSVTKSVVISWPTAVKLSCPRRSFGVMMPMGMFPSTTMAAPWARLCKRLLV